MNEPIETPKGTKLSTIFLVVLGLHIAVIVTISAYHLLRGASPERLSSTETVLEEEAMDLAASTQANPGQVEIDHENLAPLPMEEVASQPIENPQLPMPAAGDAIWENPNPALASPLPDPAAAQAAALSRGPELATVQNVPAFQQAVPAASAPVTPTGRSYTVKQGDTLGKIAKSQGVTVVALREANGLKNDMIRLGQKLNLPGSAGSVASLPASSTAVVQAPSAKVPAPAASSVMTYKVAAGDTLWKIAKSFNTKPAVIAELNGIKDPSTLKPGQTLKVPSGRSQAEADAKGSTPKPELRQADLAMGKQN